MKKTTRFAMLAAAALAVAAPAAAQPTLPAGDVTAGEIKAFIDALPRDAISDRPIRAFDAGSHRIVIPGRTPHWWSSLDSDIRYLIIRSTPGAPQEPRP